ncbi:lipid A deacylase LpxR family protein [Solimonas soli]|uniref:lipid A deacylase LpxR family protein n=1 Tax=Solimonas soli TaxID=413479 RepID=UPI0004BC44EF|nr:lipid A deacylase LpxR family protein [Solimonas soli]
MKSGQEEQDAASSPAAAGLRRALRGTALLLVLAWAAPHGAQASNGEIEPPNSEPLKGVVLDETGRERADTGWTFYFDNDTLTPTERDEDYTGGIAVTLAGRRAQTMWLSLDKPLGWIDNLFVPTAGRAFQLHSIQFGALAFTPGDIADAELRDGDRPYASLAYVANGRSYITGDESTVYHTSLSVGVLGTHLVPEFQDRFHEMIGARKPRGWDHQIADGGEPTFRYTLTRQDLRFAGTTGGGTRYEVKSAAAGSVGYLTEGTAALSWRWGRINTPWWAGPPDRVEYIAEPAPSTGGSVMNPGSREFYVWGGVKLHARLYNSFLQGQFRDSDLDYGESDVRPLIGEGWIGVTAQLYEEYRLSWVVRYQTSELKREPGDRSMLWGGLVLSHDL